MNAAPRFPSLLVALVFLGLVACQTPNRGTSTVTSPEETSEADQQVQPNQAQPNQAQPNQVQPNQVQPNQIQQDTIEHNKTPSHLGLERDTARPGSDYREVALDSLDPVACQKMCDAQMRCMAFTYVGPTDEEGPRCQLKHSIPDKVADQACCVSGVNPRAKRRLAQLEAQGFELDTDRPGANFRSFEMDRPEPSVCQEACENLIECEAFTYVRPGHRGKNAHCQLKTMATDKVADQDCCISGVK